eukprot:870358-Pleurochrysis_carterae.AAC.3
MRAVPQSSRPPSLASTALLTHCMIASIPSMEPTFNMLAERLLATLDSRDPSLPAYWVAVAGGPGAGKSTLADAVTDRVNARLPGSTVVLPMDGFHYSKARLRELDPPNADHYLPRRGAPWTVMHALHMAVSYVGRPYIPHGIASHPVYSLRCLCCVQFDAEGLCDALRAAKATGEASLPTYCRVRSDPVPGGAVLKPSHRCVIVEGNYLLMRDDPRWAPLEELWDERWYVSCASAAEQRERLINRHLETWNDEKSARWGEGRIGAAARADANDVKNMEIIAASAPFADLLIESI